MSLSDTLVLSPTCVLEFPFYCDEDGLCITHDALSNYKILGKEVGQACKASECDLNVGNMRINSHCCQVLNTISDSGCSRTDNVLLQTASPAANVSFEQKSATEPSPPAPTVEAANKLPEDQFSVIADVDVCQASTEASKSLEPLDGAVQDPISLLPSREDEPLSSEEANIAYELRTLCLKLPCTGGLLIERAASLPAKNKEADGKPQNTHSLQRAVSDPSDSSLTSAMRGGRQRPSSLRVQWDPDVKDPAPSIASHTVGGPSAIRNGQKRQQTDNKRKGSKKNQKTRGKGKMSGRM